MNTPMARRTILLGAGFSLIAAGAVSLEAPAAMSGDVAQLDAELIALGIELDHLRTICRALEAEKHLRACRAEVVCRERGILRNLPDHRRNPAFDAVRAEAGYDAVWRRWSKVLNESFALAARIDALPATSVNGLAIKFRAMLWSQFHDTMADSIDAEHLERLQAFDCELRRLAGLDGLNRR